MDLLGVRHIAEGFRLDLIELLEEYAERSTFDYKVFCEIWKEMQFSMVYFGRESQSELSEFTQQIFFITIGYLQEKFPIHYRTGALYVLYGLFIKQPKVHPGQICKIRVVKDQWGDIIKLHEQSIKDCMNHLLFVILKLMKLKAFHFVGSNTLMGPKSTMTWDLIAEKSQTLETLKKPIVRFTEACNFDRLSNMHEKYKEKLNSLSKKYEIDCTLEDNQYLSMKADMQKLIETKSFDDVEPGPSIGNIGYRRSGLKMKQFGTESSSKFVVRRKELLCKDSDSDEISGRLSDVILGSPSTSMAHRSQVFGPRRSRTRKKRKVGRPRKNASEEEEEEEEEEKRKRDLEFLENIDEEVLLQKPFEKPRRPKRHYQTSQKI